MGCKPPPSGLSSALLALSGHAVEVAASGPAGIEAVRHHPPDVMLCDIGLPGMDGYAVARELRQDPPTAALCLVALTGYGGPEDQRRSREAGFERHLVKPVDLEKLDQLLAGVAGRSRGERAAVPEPAPLAGQGRAPKQPGSILIVEDEVAMGETLARLLQEEGY
jgi:CheY-like chemotaxis protein